MAHSEKKTNYRITDNLTGFFICPLCSQVVELGLPYNIKHLPFVFHLTQNSLLNSNPPICPECGGRMWLNKVFSGAGKLVFDSRHFL